MCTPVTTDCLKIKTISQETFPRKDLHKANTILISKNMVNDLILKKLYYKISHCILEKINQNLCPYTCESCDTI